MTTDTISYRAGYKYQLAEDYPIATKIRPAHDITTDFIDLDSDGQLVVKKGYAWDGTSGPVLDTPQNLRASLVHDALYQLMRMRELEVREHRDRADRLFRTLCKQDGVLPPVATAYYEMLKRLGRPSADPENRRPVRVVPDASRGDAPHPSAPD